jgi:lipopolysaccharide transport system ATP-binding protein
VVRDPAVQKYGKEFCRSDLIGFSVLAMSKLVITVENLSKSYWVGHRSGKRERYTTVRDVMVREARNFTRKALDFARGRQIVQGDEVEQFWALKDVSFEIKRGEVVGIIGRNGAGKSTLLKILSRITEPTEGRVKLCGRVASLLEVGTGFHPELTGRENIFLNGAILGMTRQEIRQKFDAIVAFAEVEHFLDTPVKRYSSGMYVRLAFAVAAHLDPEILIIDEVLAVGDVAFQKKCLGKIEDVADGGRTVLLVSHNMASISSLCARTFWMNGGELVKSGLTTDVIHGYLETNRRNTDITLGRRLDRTGDGSARLISIQITDANGNKVIQATSRLCIKIAYRSESPLRRASFMVGVYDYTDHGIFLLNSEYVGGLPERLPPEGTIVCNTESINLTPGKCYVNIALMQNGTLADYVQYAADVHVEAEDFYGTGKLPSRDWVSSLLKHNWSLTD